MTNATATNRRTGRTELQEWYLGRLRPRVAEAVRSGVVPAAAAAALDRQVTQLLELPPDRHKEAA